MIVCFRYQKYTYSRKDGHYLVLSQLYGLEIDITCVHDIFPIDREDRLYLNIIENKYKAVLRILGYPVKIAGYGRIHKA